MENKNTYTKRVVFVTGLSGAGMSSALKALEDLGYEVFDNFPLSLIEPLLTDPLSGSAPLAIGIDTRTRGFDPKAVIEAAQRFSARLAFVTCDEAVLQKRFTETRRRHPQARDRPASAGIKKELSLLHPLRLAADPVIDTTDLSIHDLRRIMAGHFEEQGDPNLTVTVMSFGFRHGLPREADMVFDVRFLKNPHWDPGLKPFTGKDAPVAAHIEGDDALEGFMASIQTLLEPLLPRYRAEGRAYLTIAFGCTGGKHRSVYVAERLGRWIAGRIARLSVEHRDIDRPA